MDNLPKITIVTVVKNSVNTIEKAIQSVINQHYPNLEYIILDGNSDDGTCDIIKKYDKEISFWKSEDDQGTSYVYNASVGIANGEIIGYLNADDFYEDGVLLKVGKLFQENADLDIISFKYRVVELENDEYIAKRESSLSEIGLDKNKDCACLGINAKFFKKEIFLKYGAPLESIKDGQQFLSNDVELLIRLALNGVKNLALDEVGYNYLASANSFSFSEGYAKNSIYIEDKILIAQRFLSDEFKHLLNPIWEKKFKKWIKKYRAKLVINLLSNRKSSLAKNHFLLGVKENGFFKFSLYLLKTFIRN